jgi:ATP-binding cassette subfamily F protein 3
MLEITDLTYRIAGRLLFDDASAFLAEGWKVGLVGRNGTGKSTLLRLIREEAESGRGAIRLRRGASMGFVAQEIAPNDTPLLEVVLSAHREMAALNAEAETATDPQRISDIHARLGELDAYSAEARASSILVGLGFAQSDLTRASREFSGGWRMRAALAGVLFSAPDVLLLDEPTNFLDLEGAAWLEDYLKAYPHTVVVVSHDRDMLNRAVTHILALAENKLEVFVGGYDAYLTRRAERAALQGAMKAKQDRERAHLQSFIDRFRAKASKATQAQSRIKRLEKMQEIALPLEERALPFSFEDPEELASPLVVLDHADLGYAKGKPVLRNVGFRLDHDDRVVVIGPNGEGKTTLVKSIAGLLALLSGQRTVSNKLDIGYFSQDQLDLLRPDESALDHIRDLEPDWPQAKQRGLAARLGFGHEKVETKVESLSGGEKVRLSLGLIAHAKPHALILDEPTSHLDIDSREALIHAVNAYTGAVMLITHDVYLAEACADRLWLVKDGRVVPFDDDMEGYRRLLLSERSGPPLRAAAEVKPKARRAPAVTLSPLRAEVARCEARVGRLEEMRTAIDMRLANPLLYSRGDAEEIESLQKKRAEVEDGLARAETLWVTALERLEDAGERV